MMQAWAARAVLALVWLLHFLPLPCWRRWAWGWGGCCCMRWPGRAGASRCATWSCANPGGRWPSARPSCAEHFGWLGRSLLERGLLWYASPTGCKRLIHVEGDIGWPTATRAGGDVAGAALPRHGRGRRRQPAVPEAAVATIYQSQSNPVFDRAIRRGRLRFGQGEVFSRHDSALPLVRAIKRGAPSSTCPTWTSGCATRPSCPSSACRRHAAGAVAHGAFAEHGGAAGGGPRCCPAARATGCASANPGPTGRPTTPRPTRGA
jgi:KDO2-lipid IV(A) lauroyltransferase